jgi:hypothetical protein
MQAHRAAWVAFYGQIPRGLFVCHRCDVRACVNPEHLFLGTPQDNMDDMVRKSRQVTPRGSRNGASKLTADQVLDIRRLSAEGVSYAALGRQFGIADVTAHQIATRQRWAHL